MADSYICIADIHSTRISCKLINALTLYLEALEIRSKSRFKQSIRVAECYVKIGSVLVSLSKFEEASSDLNSALNILLELFKGKNEILLAETYHQLGRLCLCQCHYDKAIQMYQKCLDIKSELSGNDHIQLIEIYNDIAVAYIHHHQCDTAIEIFEKALAIPLELENDQTMIAASVYGNIAVCHTEQGRTSEALLMLDKCVTIVIKLIGPQHLN